jgi:hypothetical protein
MRLPTFSTGTTAVQQTFPLRLFSGQGAMKLPAR